MDIEVLYAFSVKYSMKLGLKYKFKGLENMFSQLANDFEWWVPHEHILDNFSDFTRDSFFFLIFKWVGHSWKRATG